jgi:hypothetical protein
MNATATATGIAATGAAGRLAAREKVFATGTRAPALADAAMKNQQGMKHEHAATGRAAALLSQAEDLPVLRGERAADRL